MVPKEVLAGLVGVHVGVRGVVNKVVILLHGFLGTGDEWIPTMKAISACCRCISIDLPGHGESKIKWRLDGKTNEGASISVELVADVLHKLFSEVTNGKVVVVGYSLGARIALYMAMKYSQKIEGTVLISGSPGIEDDAARSIRSAQDDARAHYLTSQGLQSFLRTWYAGEMWSR
ncbi:hypothetical protein Taro_023674 [Colocasia esculenta]|uniref:AB hydrolase-1 domain-containing protein n=1 Tax=Colocasia esculenta TaxID=4460 RepID=A0A843VBH4_COLES|nr:hypothetical protein [Colocasia esculenta]